MTVIGIWIKREKRGPMLAVDPAVITEKEGLLSDWRGSRDPLRQVSVLSAEQWEEACRELDEFIPPKTRRANICVQGYSFGPKDIGKRIEFQNGVVLEITGETEPCGRMNELHPGLRQALKPNWRGGVTCRVIQKGNLRFHETFLIRNSS